MKLSENFVLSEFARSDTAIRCGIDNTPPDNAIMNLKRLCKDVLEPLRVALGTRIRITSGYRCYEVNKAIGGSFTSEHCSGRAADIESEGISIKDICKTIIRLKLPYNQVIYEFGEWCHVSISELGKEPKRQVLTASKVNGKTIYSEGIK